MKTTLLLIVSFIFLVMTACNSEKKESKIQTKDALENIMGRKSVRKYLPKPVEKEKIEVLLKAGMAAPSGKDVRPWELIVIDDREVLDSMAADEASFRIERFSMSLGERKLILSTGTPSTT